MREPHASSAWRTNLPALVWTVTRAGRSFGVFGDHALSEAEKLAELGVSRIVVPAFLFYQNTEESLAAYGDSVIKHLNS